MTGSPLQRCLLGVVRGYRFALSPWLGSSCRFAPTCSQYALEALDRHGAVTGLALTLNRLARCQPWCAGGHDAVPAAAPALFTALVRQRRPEPAEPAPADAAPFGPAPTSAPGSAPT